MSANATVGTYLAHWRIGSGAPGAPTLDLKTVVSAPTHHLQGAGDITQAVNPPINVHTLVSGNYSQMGTAVLISLTGTTQQGGMQNFQCHIHLPNGWNQNGAASYRYLSGNTWHDVENVTATAIHTEQAMTSSSGSAGSSRRG